MQAHEYMCMVCGVIDENVMLVDERSELKRQWEGGENDQNINKCSSFCKLPGLMRISTSVAPVDAAHRRALAIAQKASRHFSIETDQIPSEATCMYMATCYKKSETCHVCGVEVIACTMIAAHRRTAQDIEDVSLAFRLKFKNVATAIEDVQKLVMRDKAVADTYGYLFNSVSDRRPAELVKEAMNHLLEMTPGNKREELLDSTWGIRSLADDMMKHVLDSRLTGGGSLQLLARAMVVMACEFHGLTTQSSYISNCILVIHRATWKASATMWPGGLQAFARHVKEKCNMREYGGTIKKKPVAARVEPAIKASLLGKRLTRRHVQQEFEADFVSRFANLAGTGTGAGVTHMCIVTAANSAAVRKFLETDTDTDAGERTRILMDVCIAAVLGTPYPSQIDASTVSLITGTVGFEREVATSRRFHSVKLPRSGGFIPKELMRWGTRTQ